MTINKNKLNITIAVATGLLVGYVFGAAFGSSDSTLETTGSAQGNISKISSYHSIEKSAPAEIESVQDTLSFSAVDADGKSWTIVMTNNE